MQLYKFMFNKRTGPCHAHIFHTWACWYMKFPKNCLFAWLIEFYFAPVHAIVPLLPRSHTLNLVSQTSVSQLGDQNERPNEEFPTSFNEAVKQFLTGAPTQAKTSLTFWEDCRHHRAGLLCCVWFQNPVLSKFPRPFFKMLKKFPVWLSFLLFVWIRLALCYNWYEPHIYQWFKCEYRMYLALRLETGRMSGQFPGRQLFKTHT